jgi:sortase A
VSFDRLILSACHPLYSAAKRIVVFAKLEQARARFR